MAGYQSVISGIKYLMRSNFFILLILLSFSCLNNSEKDIFLVENRSNNQGKKETIAIQPFTGIDKNLIQEIKKGMIQYLAVEITVLEIKKLPPSAFYKTRQRYIADSLLRFLRSLKQDEADRIIGITSFDISTRKKPYQNWGVMGLGYCPGESCIISSYRVKPTSGNYHHFINRMIILALHELGHTYSLPHCPVKNCIMNDAEGKMKLDDTKTYCVKCSRVLLRKRVLK